MIQFPREFATLCVCTVAASSAAQPMTVVPELEPNDVPAAAQEIAPGTVFDFQDPNDLIAIIGTFVTGEITPGDVDYFSISFDPSAGGVTLVDLQVLDGPSGTFQMLAVDALTGEALSFDNGSGTVQLERPDQLAPGERTVLFAVSAGRDLEPALDDAFNVFGTDSIAGTQASFDGRDFETGEPHPESFEYRLTFVPGFVPSPGALAVLGFGGAVAARRSRRQ